MSRPSRLLAQIRGRAEGLSSGLLLAQTVAITAQANGWRCVDFSAAGDWATAPLDRLTALPEGTPTVLHIGTDHDVDVSSVDAPGAVLLIDHGGPTGVAPPASWLARCVGRASPHVDGHVTLEYGPVADVRHLGSRTWVRVLAAIAPDRRETALLEGHAGPHLTACGPLETREATRWIGATSALVQHLRPGATVALLATDPRSSVRGLAHQIAELGLDACQLTAETTPGQLRSHLADSDAYLASPRRHLDPGVALARALGIPVVTADPTGSDDVVFGIESIAEVAAAIDVALDRPHRPAATEPDDTWLWPLLASAGA